MRTSLFERRFVILSGKGGVGRSTLAAALGIAAARAGLRTCLVQLGARDNLRRMLDGGLASYEPVRVDPALPLFACNLQPAEALREYGVMKLRFAALHNLVFENDVMRRLLRMIPGMNEMLLLGKAWHMEAVEQREGGQPAWDVLIIDAPATGHGVSLLRLPQVILSAVPVGPMAEDARSMQALLQDPARTALHVVTLPQELPATEALELCATAERTLGVPTGYLFVNQVLPKGLSDSQRSLLPRLAQLAASDPLASAAVSNATAYEHWRNEQQRQLARLHRHARLPVVEVPHLLRPIGPAEVAQLADVVEAGAEAADRHGAVRPSVGWRGHA